MTGLPGDIEFLQECYDSCYSDSTDFPDIYYLPEIVSRAEMKVLREYANSCGAEFLVDGVV